MSKRRDGKFRFTWIVENYSMCCQSKGEFFDSPLFTFNSLPGMQWCIRLYPNGKVLNNELVVGVFRNDDFSEECNVELSIRVLNCQDQLLFTLNEITKVFEPKTLWESDDFLKSDSFLQLLINDILIIKCTLQPICQISEEEILPQLSHKNEIFTDVVLRAQGESFKVNKAILWARCPKLAEELDAENSSEKVLDIQPNVLATIIEYIYTGSVTFSMSESLQLYHVMEKYEIRNQSSLPFIAQKAKTRVNAEEISFRWPIENFFSLPDDTYLYSHVFTVRCVSSCNWNLKLHILNSYEGRFEIFLCKIDNNESEPIFVTSKISFDRIYISDMHLFQMDKTWRCAENYSGIYRDPLLLECEFKFANCHYSSEIVKSSCEVISSIKCPYYYNDLKHLYRSEKASNINIVVGSKIFHAHKFILCARSTVFSRMLQIQMSESTSGTVQIPDVQPDIMDELLLFIYSGKLEKPLEETAMQLYSAADKYDVPALKKKCSSFLKSNIHIKNVCKILQLADMHSDSDLYDSALVFFSTHSQQVFLTDEWKEISKENLWFKHLENVIVLKRQRYNPLWNATT